MYVIHAQGPEQQYKCVEKRLKVVVAIDFSFILKLHATEYLNGNSEALIVMLPKNRHLHSNYCIYEKEHPDKQADVG